VNPLARYTARVTRAITRGGVTASVYRLSEGTPDRYGKTTKEWQKVAEVPVALFYLYKDQRRELQSTEIGRLATEEPMVAVPKNAAAHEGDRLEVPGGLYRLDTRTTYPTHDEYTTTRVTE
jgi:hypothetical protein